MCIFTKFNEDKELLEQFKTNIEKLSDLSVVETIIEWARKREYTVTITFPNKKEEKQG